MANSSETKVTRRDAILMTGKLAATVGAAALFGRVPTVRANGADDEDDDDIQQPSGGLSTASKFYFGNDTSPATPTSHPVNVGIVPIEFVISLDPSDPNYGMAPPSGNAIGTNGVTVIAIGDSCQVYVWTDSGGREGLYKNSARGLFGGTLANLPIVSGTFVDVGALEAAVRSLPLAITGLNINGKNPPITGSGIKYRLLAFGSPSTVRVPDDDDDGD